MKKLLPIIIAILMIVTTTPLSVAAQGNTVVLYTNDVHCAIDDYAVLAAYRADLISDGHNVITVDVGDAIQGEVIGTLTDGSAIVDIMNAVGYDYAVPGNHEFDYGMDTFLDIAQTKSDYEYLSSNFYDLSSLSGVLDAYAIEEVNGKKIAFIGISSPSSRRRERLVPSPFMMVASGRSSLNSSQRDLEFSIIFTLIFMS